MKESRGCLRAYILPMHAKVWPLELCAMRTFVRNVVR